MAKNTKQTSQKAASAASKVLRDGRTGKASKTAAGSALAQTPKKKSRQQVWQSLAYAEPGSIFAANLVCVFVIATRQRALPAPLVCVISSYTVFKVRSTQGST